jgi:hypothetical protein
MLPQISLARDFTNLPVSDFDKIGVFLKCLNWTVDQCQFYQNIQEIRGAASENAKNFVKISRVDLLPDQIFMIEQFFLESVWLHLESQ